MNKKLLLSIVLISCISTSVLAQKLQLGFKGGATLNKISGKSFDESFSFGYHIGAFVEVGLGDKFSIQPELLFNQVNIDTSSSFSSVYQFNNVNNIQLKYLSIPLLLNFKASKIVSLQVGPQFGILIDQNENLLQNGKDAFKRGEFSMIGGLQLNILKFKVYGRYVVGLNNINDIDNTDKWTNQSIQLGVGFRLL